MVAAARGWPLPGVQIAAPDGKGAARAAPLFVSTCSRPDVVFITRAMVVGVEPRLSNDRPPVLATADLRGRDLAAVHARLGNPSSCAFDGHELLLAYESDDGEAMPRALVLADGIVVRALPRLRRRPASPFGGQLIARVLPALGPLLGMLSRPAGLELVFASSRVFVHEDRVAHLAPAPAPLGMFVLPGDLGPFTAAG